jgi:hypothetical protein
MNSQPRETVSYFVVLRGFYFRDPNGHLLEVLTA